MKNLLRYSYLSLISCLFVTAGFAQGVSFSPNGAVPNANAMIDMNVAALGTKTGLLIPRMTAAQRLAIAGPADGLWVFQTDNATSGGSGLWYYDTNAGGSWNRLATGNGWQIVGNASVPAYFAGTSDAADFVLGTSGIPRITFTPAGRMGIGTATPVEALEIDGAIHFDPSAAANLTNNAGGLRYNATEDRHEGNIDGTAAGWTTMENAFDEVLNQNYSGTSLTCGPGNEVTVGTANSQSSGNVDTPFPTAVGRNSKAQYIFTQAELLADGLCAGQITQLAFRVIIDATPATSYAIRIRLSNTTQNSFGTWVPLWNGVDNLVVEVSYQRQATPGLSPPVLITSNTGGVPRSRIGYIPTNTAGWLLDDAPLFPTNLGTIAGSFLGSNVTRPVIRFRGVAQGPVPTLAQDDYAVYEGGLSVGGAAWAAGAGLFKGPGVIQAENSVWDGSVQLSDHVFDQYFDGRVQPEDVEKLTDYEWKDLDELKTFMDNNRHLPNMPSRSEWEANGKLSLGEIQNGLWETIEQQALYIAELEADLKLLEDLAYKQGMTDEDLERLVAKVNNNGRLTSDQKEHITQVLRDKHLDAQGKVQK